MQQGGADPLNQLQTLAKKRRLKLMSVHLTVQFFEYPLKKSRLQLDSALMLFGLLVNFESYKETTITKIHDLS